MKEDTETYQEAETLSAEAPTVTRPEVGESSPRYSIEISV